MKESVIFEIVVKAFRLVMFFFFISFSIVDFFPCHLSFKILQQRLLIILFFNHFLIYCLYNVTFLWTRIYFQKIRLRVLTLFCVVYFFTIVSGKNISFLPLFLYLEMYF